MKLCFKTLSMVIALLASLILTQGGVSPANAQPNIGATPYVTNNLNAWNSFARARGLTLSDDQIELYIDRSVIGGDRFLVHRLMAAMPAHLRGDLITWFPGTTHVVSNNPRLLRYVKLSSEARRTSGGIQLLKTWNKLRDVSGLKPQPFDYSSNCAPPPITGGPTIRDVSTCGMTDGWGFVYVPCGTSNFSPGDAGYLYMELTGSGGYADGSTIEGGFQYNSDASIQGYVRASYLPGGYQTMHYQNPNYHYQCNEKLVVSHGVAATAGNYIYTMVGQLPSNIDPASQYINMNSQFFYPDNYMWLWSPPAGDVGGVGVDQAGYPTPCQYCSITKVTSIAQGAGLNYDGSYFGTNGSLNQISWFEVIFGEYASACNGQAGGTCQIESAADPSRYYAGSQSFPDPTTAQTNMGPTGWGPYESYDGIALSGSTIAGKVRRPLGTFNEPLPPMPCTADSLQNCIVVNSEVISSTCYDHSGQLHSALKRVYSVYRNATPAKYLETATLTQTAGPPSQGCPMTNHWYPSEPRLQYNDPSLP